MLLTRAIVLAAKAHDGQKYGDVPYIFHPLEVARMLQQRGFPEHVVAAGVLHDVPEDTDVTVEEIATQVDPRVAEIVGQLDKSKFEGDEAAYILGLKDPEVVVVKLADSTANYLGLGSITDPVRKEKLQNRYLRNISHLTMELALAKRPFEMPLGVYSEAITAHPRGWMQ